MMEANEINVNVSFSCEGTRWNLETDRLNGNGRKGRGNSRGSTM